MANLLNMEEALDAAADAEDQYTLTLGQFAHSQFLTLRGMWLYVAPAPPTPIRFDLRHLLREHRLAVENGRVVYQVAGLRILPLDPYLDLPTILAGRACARWLLHSLFLCLTHATEVESHTLCTTRVLRFGLRNARALSRLAPPLH